MSNRDGTPIWYDLMTDAPDDAQAFYSRVVGWTFERPAGGMERDYRTFTAPDGEGVGGVMRAPDGAPHAPVWTVYFGVSDVDAMTGKATVLGAHVHIAPTDILGIGRFAYLADPQGAMFYLMRGDNDGQSTSFAPTKAGHCSWNELVTCDQNAALDFYGALFGWKKTGAMPMGAMGEYAFVDHGGTEIGAMMTARDRGETPFWNFAFAVPDIDAAKEAVERGGGTVIHGPTELPGEQGDWLIQGRDPQGARVMFNGPRETVAA